MNGSKHGQMESVRPASIGESLPKVSRARAYHGHHRPRSCHPFHEEACPAAFETANWVGCLNFEGQLAPESRRQTFTDELRRMQEDWVNAPRCICDVIER